MISYSGLTNYGKATLPSIDSWNSDNNILRDPPKSIHTRRVDKVGETSSLTTMIDESSDRACENIQVYARGVNPFVSVSYSNHGNNGGQRSGGMNSMYNQAASLPRKILKDGAFRPPVLLQEDLLPLSRLPRGTTSAFTKPGFADFSKKLRTCGSAENTKEVKTATLYKCARPTATYKIEKPIEEPFEVRNVIQPILNKSVNSGIKSMDITQKYNGLPTKEIDHDPLHTFARTNLRNDIHINNNEFDPERYIQNTNAHAVTTNVSTNKYHSNIEDVVDLSDLPIQNKLNYNVVAPVSSTERVNYIHEDMELDRSLPVYQTRTNISDNRTDKRMNYENTIEFEKNTPLTHITINPVAKGDVDHSSRDARLNDKISLGGFNGRAQIPSINRIDYSKYNMETNKTRMNRVVNENMSNKFTHS